MDLEYSITQYLDGSLDERERDALEVRLASDAEARALLEEHQKLDGLLKAGGLPELKWEAVASQISAAVATLDVPREEAPSHSLKMPWVRFVAPLALAASVLIAAGLGIRFVHFGNPASSVARKSEPAPAAVAVITGPQIETSDAPAQSEVSVGPARSLAADSLLPHYSDDVIMRPSRVTVASGINPAQDIPPASFDVQ